MASTTLGSSKTPLRGWGSPGYRDSRLGAGVVGDLLDDLAVHLIPQDLVLCAQLGNRQGCHLAANRTPGLATPVGDLP